MNTQMGAILKRIAPRLFLQCKQFADGGRYDGEQRKGDAEQGRRADHVALGARFAQKRTRGCERSHTQKCADARARQPRRIFVFCARVKKNICKRNQKQKRGADRARDHGARRKSLALQIIIAKILFFSDGQRHKDKK